MLQANAEAFSGCIANAATMAATQKAGAFEIPSLRPSEIDGVSYRFGLRLSRFGRDGEAKILADWLASPDGQKAIGDYHINGQRLFNPSATTPR